MDASPIPTENIGVWMHTDNIQKNASIGTAETYIATACFHTNNGGSKNS